MSSDRANRLIRWWARMTQRAVCTNRHTQQCTLWVRDRSDCKEKQESVGDGMERTATATLFNTNTHPAKPWYWPHVAVRAMAWARTDVQVGTHEPTNGHSPPTHHTHTSCRSREHNLRHSITAAPGCCTAGCCTVLVDTFRVIIILDMTKENHHHHHHHHQPGGPALQHNRPH
jgi:hypothetical protein